MAVIATLSKGYDLDYIWKQIDDTQAAHAVNYYIQPAEAGGEPPGRWWGPAAEALGFQPGEVVERKPYELLFGERKAPDGTPLARMPDNGKKVAGLYEQLLAAEPHATAERKRELLLEATRHARQSPLFFDLTLSLSKSISIFHASLGENARLAREAADTAGEAYWSGLVAEVDAMIYQAVHAGFDYFQREAGYTRTGSHNARVHGRETGQWREADLVVAHWLQHTSRDGDMQLHVHSQIAHVARTRTDGKWRAPDSLGYNEHIGAVAAITAQHLEEALTGRFGIEWTARDDGHGFEIKGISGKMMRLFSSRRESISADLRARAKRFEQRYGRAPSQRELAQLAQSSNFATRKSKEGALDTAELHAGWADKLARAQGIPLASVAPSVWHAATGNAATRDAEPASVVPEELALSRTAQQALALAQQEKSTWTRADLVKYLGRVLPRSGRDPAQAAELLEETADRILRSEFDPVLCLEVPEPAEVPRDLLRADGRSVYRRHGGVRYATRAQLSMEDRLVAQAAAQAAPRLSHATGARALGADTERLVRTLAGQPNDATLGQRTGSGLREDQAAAALSVLTDGCRVSVINAPAGAGKTRVLAEVAKAWAGAGLGPVVGITASQSARNTLAGGVPGSYNSAQFLGHLPAKRGARGPAETGPGTLMLIDEASMMSGLDLADLISLAGERGGKVILAGDTGQLQAVQNGGGMSLLAGRLGYVRLAQPVRFRAPWEQAATLRLREGDTSVLAEYDQHARITGGDPEQMMDAAASAYVSLTAAGTDALLMTADHTLRRELSRRIRDDLLRLGLVRPGPGVRIADGTTASRGDLIVCTRNDHRVEAGEPGRTLANGDLLRIDAVTGGGLLVRRALDADRETGQRRWTDRQFLYADFKEAELGYAVTDHAAQGRTVHTGLAVFTGSEDRQHAYVALTRGTDENTAYVFTVSPKRADSAPGPRPAPELARYDRLTAQPGDHGQAGQSAGPEDALGVMAQVLGKDGQESSASQTWRDALADADHLAVLHAIWTAETSPARDQRYRQLLAAVLPPGYEYQPGHREKWLWRTLRAAELAGLDAREVLAAAVAGRDLTGARDIPAVIDSRIRRRTGALVPLPASAWSEQVPEAGDPERRAYLAQVAGLMDARKERIGVHAADAALPWAAGSLGQVPSDPAGRLEWQRRASSIGAYRELSGHDDPADPIGLEPAASSPDLRAAWYEALAALGPVDGPDVRGMNDGLLLRLRESYPVETAWAPPWPGDALRRTRAAARDARLTELRATAEAAAADRRGEREEARRQQSLASSYRSMRQAYEDFGKTDLSQLTVPEMALLAAMPKGASRYNPRLSPEAAIERRNLVLQAMADQKYITAAEHVQYERQPLRLVDPKKEERARIFSRFFTGHLANYFHSLKRKNLRDERWRVGGFDIRTALDQRLQEIVMHSLQKGLREFEDSTGRYRWKPWIDIRTGKNVNLRGPANHATVSEITHMLQILRIAHPYPETDWLIGMKMPGGKKGPGTRWLLETGERADVSEGDARIFSSLKDYDVALLENGDGRVHRLASGTDVQGAAVMMDIETGDVLALSGGFSAGPYGVFAQNNRATGSLRQPGSSVKPFIYLYALNKGIKPEKTLSDYAVRFPKINKCPFRWAPGNYGHSGGEMPLETALQKSINRAVLSLFLTVAKVPFNRHSSSDLGYASPDIVNRITDTLYDVYDFAADLGAYPSRKILNALNYRGPCLPFLLGGQETTPLRMAQAYASIGNGGLRREAVFLREVLKDGQPLIVDESERKREELVLYRIALKRKLVTDPEAFGARSGIHPLAVATIRSVMQGVLRNGTAIRIKEWADLIAGKTGTTNDSKDAWFIGFNAKLVVAVWVGYDNRKKYEGLGSGTGGAIAVPIFKMIMEEYYRLHPEELKHFLPPPSDTYGIDVKEF